jgi:general secretion pathway protein F
MSSFQYRALDGAGHEVRGVLDAPDHRSAVAMVEKTGSMALEIIQAKPQAPNPLDLRAIFAGASVREEVTRFFAELGHLLRAGLQLDDALALLQEEFGSGRLAEITAHFRARLAAGSSFAESLRTRPDLIPLQIVAMIEVSEATGTLPSAVVAIAAARQREEKLRRELTSALRYPLFLMAMAFCVLLFILLFVMPNFTQVFAGTTAALPTGAAFLYWASTWLSTNLELALGGLAVAILSAYLIARLPASRQSLRRLAERVPGLNTLCLHARTVTFARQLALLLGNGVQLLVAIELIARFDTAGSDLDSVAHGLRRGDGLAESLRRVGKLPGTAVRMLKVGEETGDLAGMANRVAEIYEDKLSQSVPRIVGAVGPVAILTIGLIIAWLFAGVLTALVSINDLAI